MVGASKQNVNTKSKASSNPYRKRSAPTSGDRSKATIKRLNMYRTRTIRTKDGQVVGGDLMSKDRAGNKKMDSTNGRIAPNRRWFGNTRVVDSKELETFREEMDVAINDPYSVVLKRKTLPMALLKTHDSLGVVKKRTDFSKAFQPKASGKRPKNVPSSLEALMKSADDKNFKFQDSSAQDQAFSAKSYVSAADHVLTKGQSKRIWAELYKVLDCSDVVVHVLDCRDPISTRSNAVEKWISEKASHKHLVLLLNKVDLVPAWHVKRWMAHLSKERPVVAFNACTPERSFGKGPLIALLRQFAKLHVDKKELSVSFVGYPNVGKSSVINAVRGEAVCNVAPIPGETKVWQYVSLFDRVSLIDCPGVVPFNGTESDAQLVLNGVVRSEKLESPEDYIDEILLKIDPKHVSAAYDVDIDTAKNADALLETLAMKRGRLTKGGRPNIKAVAVNVINDLQRGRVPWFTPAPERPAENEND